MEERIRRDTCRVCGKQSQEYREICEDGQWYPAPEVPQDFKFGFCDSMKCWFDYLAQLLLRCANRRGKEKRKNRSEVDDDHNGIPFIGGAKNSNHRDGRESMKGYNKGRH
jgi:hypothetical protein